MLILGGNFIAPHANVLAEVATSSSGDRKPAFQALGDMGEAAIPHVPMMAAHLGVEGDSEVSEADPEVQAAAAGALAQLGPLAADASSLLAKRLLSRADSDTGSDPQEVAERKQLARGTVALALSPAEPRDLPRRPLPRRSARDWEAWQLPSEPAGLSDQEADRQKLTRRSPEQAVQSACIQALGQMGLPGAQTLTECLQHLDPEMQALSLKTLRTFPEVCHLVVDKLEHAFWPVRQAAVDCVYYAGQVGKAGEMLVPGLSDEDAFVRHLHVQALGLLESMAAPEAPFLALRLRDPCWSVRAAAMRTLDLIGTASVPSLTASLQEIRRPSCVWPAWKPWAILERRPVARRRPSPGAWQPKSRKCGTKR
ncbi:unnamed protein product [Effrenium voratum]|nr:unnamed protein product [Effrenium voratum]